jgi:3'-phosphoadenosine 5'-phosphosulfate sulfotransferase (PAPS reductase)/FAD synthetase
METMTQPRELVARGALFVVNHSGGKDSQAMMIHLLRQGIPAKQMVVIHASLGEMEWNGALELAEKQAAEAGAPFIVARAIYEDGSPKTLLNKTEHQFARRPEVPSWPSKQQRWCTSELKTGPITRETLRYAKANGYKLIVNCVGIRAAESTDRAKLEPFKQLTNKHPLGKAGREAYNWLPIFGLQTLDVWCIIRGASQMPHDAYCQGNERLSCVFCIMGSAGDIANGAKARPELFAKYVELEKKTGYTMHMNRLSLTELVASVVEDTEEVFAATVTQDRPCSFN